MWFKKIFKIKKLNRKETIISLLLMIFFIFLYLPLYHTIFNYKSEVYLNKEIKQAEVIIQNELGYLLEQANEISKIDIIHDKIEKKEIVDMLGILNYEREERDIDTMLVVDKNGIAISRVPAIPQKGDNIFQLTPFGRVVAKKKSVTSIENGQTIPLLFAAGVPIIEESEIVGAIFTGQAINNEYTQKFKRKFLENNPKDDVDFIFYSNNEGVVASSFDNKEVDRLIAIHYNLGSHFLKDKEFDNEYRVNLNNKNYLVGRIIFPGLESSPGGMLVFYNSNFWGGALTFIFLLTAVFFFVLFIYLFLIKKTILKNYKFLLIVFVVFFVILLIANIFYIKKMFIDGVNIKNYNNTIYNSNLELKPEFNLIDKSYEHSVSIKIFPGGEAINAVKVVLDYDPKKIMVEEIITTRSFCRQDMFIEKNIDNELGKVSIACGLPNPGFNELYGVVADLDIIPLETGSFDINFGEGTQVLANDGLGTNVLRSAIGGAYQIIDYSDSTKNPTNLVSVVSSSHPNSNRWYNNREIKMFWDCKNKEAMHVYAFNKSSYFIPSKDSITKERSMNFTVSSDGIYYFHVASFVDGEIGTINHFKIQIDLTPPVFLNVNASDTVISAGDLVRFEFNSSDSFSGLQSDHFYVKINNQTFLPVTSPLYAPFPKIGNQDVIIRVFDKAGNYTDKKMNVKVKR